MEVVVGGDDGGERRGRMVSVGGENGVEEEKGGKERVFNGNDGDGGERRSRHQFQWGITALVLVSRWRENGGGVKGEWV